MWPFWGGCEVRGQGAWIWGVGSTHPEDADSRSVSQAPLPQGQAQGPGQFLGRQRVHGAEQSPHPTADRQWGSLTGQERHPGNR